MRMYMESPVPAKRHACALRSEAVGFLIDLKL